MRHSKTPRFGLPFRHTGRHIGLQIVPCVSYFYGMPIVRSSAKAQQNTLFSAAILACLMSYHKLNSTLRLLLSSRAMYPIRCYSTARCLGFRTLNAVLEAKSMFGVQSLCEEQKKHFLIGNVGCAFIMPVNTVLAI